MNNRGVLFLDDEPAILNSIKRTLRNEKYNVYIANDVGMAHQILDTQDVQIVISDQKMPYITGAEFLDRIKPLFPKTIRMILSGNLNAPSLSGILLNQDIFGFVAKPWNDKELKTTLEDCFQWYDRMYHQDAA